MAFYPDELSPIERVRSVSSSDVADLNLISKNRRQWKSLILGKKDMGMNSFATITEEKEEEISNDGSQAGVVSQPNLTSNKRIVFPKPRKYISGDRVDEKEISSTATGLKTLNSPKREERVKMNLAEVRQLIKGKKDNDSLFGKTEITTNYFLEGNPGKNWKDMTTSSAPLLGWPKKEEIKSADSAKGRQCEKKKSSTAPTGSGKSSDSKTQKKNQGKGSKSPQECKKVQEKGKSLNMRDVVNVYKNLAYGSKEEIKSFVEKLSFVKDESTDKDHLSMLNLKALESKLKDFGKRPSKSEEKKSKVRKKKEKCEKRNRKAHIDQLARHKVIKVPATLNYTYSPESRSLSYASSDREQILSRRSKEKEDKIPWKYVGTQSILDKNYLVYPTIPNEPKKTKKSSSETANKKVLVEKKTEPKPNPSNRAKTSNESNKKKASSIMRFSGSNKSMNRPSATTVCKIEFRPTGKIGDLDPDDPSLLVYLHGTKAINVNSPYADKQFSRVKFFRKYGSRVPLIKGIDRDGLGNDNQNVSVKNIRLPKELSRFKYEDFDFDEDIKNLSDFLNGESFDMNKQGLKKKLKIGTVESPRGSVKGSPKLSPDLIIEEISEDLKSLQNLPDTEENRKIISSFFDELDRKIETTKAQKFVEDVADRYGQMIPIVGY